MYSIQRAGSARLSGSLSGCLRLIPPPSQRNSFFGGFSPPLSLPLSPTTQMFEAICRAALSCVYNKEVLVWKGRRGQRGGGATAAEGGPEVTALLMRRLNGASAASGLRHESMQPHAFTLFSSSSPPPPLPLLYSSHASACKPEVYAGERGWQGADTHREETMRASRGASCERPRLGFYDGPLVCSAGNKHGFSASIKAPFYKLDY